MNAVASPPQDLIARKRDGGRWSSAELRAIVDRVVMGGFDDCQLGALLMAAYLRGLDVNETCELTLAMADSGARLDWTGFELRGPVVDKHSTGGVGDLVSLVLAPILAALDCHVPMISGRGLGPTGGTLDKLESIPGFRTRLELPALQRQVADIGLAIVGATEDLVPADRILYATRDLTGTVTSIPLIAASILSKKLAEGLDALALDVKYGCGAVFESRETAGELADALGEVADHAGLRVVTALTPMDQPLAPVAGNALEVGLALRCLRGEGGAPRLMAVTERLAGVLLDATGFDQPRAAVQRVLRSGAALEAFGRMVQAQGGEARLIDAPDDHLPRAPVLRVVAAEHSGRIEAVDAGAIGRSVVLLGGGRLRGSDVIDHAVGFSSLPSVGDRVEAGDTLGVVHARDDAEAAQAAAVLVEAIGIRSAA